MEKYNILFSAVNQIGQKLFFHHKDGMRMETTRLKTLFAVTAMQQAPFHADKSLIQNLENRINPHADYILFFFLSQPFIKNNPVNDGRHEIDYQ